MRIFISQYTGTVTIHNYFLQQQNYRNQMYSTVGQYLTYLLHLLPWRCQSTRQQPSYGSYPACSVFSVMNSLLNVHIHLLVVASNCVNPSFHWPSSAPGRDPMCVMQTIQYCMILTCYATNKSVIELPACPY